MDLNLLNVVEASEKGNAFDLLHPVTGDVLTDDNSVPMTITALGSDSAPYKNEYRAQQQRNLGKKKISPEAGERAVSEVLISVILDWNIQMGGEKIKFSKQAARDLFVTHPWIKEQLAEFVTDRANFLGQPSND